MIKAIIFFYLFFTVLTLSFFFVALIWLFFFKKYIHFFNNLKINIFLFLEEYHIILIVIYIFILFILNMFISNLICQKIAADLYIDPIDKTSKYLAYFYSHQKSERENVLKLCFSEALSALYFHGAFQHMTKQNNPVDLKRIIGGECLEMAEEFSKLLLKRSHRPLSPLNLFLNNMFKKPYYSRHLIYTYVDFITYFTARFGLEWCPNTLLSSEVSYFLKVLSPEEIGFFTRKELCEKYENLINSSRFFKYLEDASGQYFIIYTDDGKKMFSILFNFLSEKNPHENYDHLFATLEDNFKFKPKRFLQFWYEVIWLYEDNMLVCLDNFYNLDMNNPGSGVKFALSYANFDTAQPVYEQLTKEIEIAQQVVHLYHYIGNSIGAKYTFRDLTLVKKNLTLNFKNGVFENSNGFVYAEVIFGDIRLCKIIEKYLHWIADAGYIRDKETFILYKKHSKIILDLLINGKEFANSNKLTYNEVLESINFILNIIRKIKPEEDAIARNLFRNLNRIKNSKTI